MQLSLPPQRPIGIGLAGILYIGARFWQGAQLQFEVKS
jgi:hypothetical protein